MSPTSPACGGGFVGVRAVPAPALEKAMCS